MTNDDKEFPIAVHVDGDPKDTPTATLISEVQQCEVIGPARRSRIKLSRATRRANANAKAEALGNNFKARRGSPRRCLCCEQSAASLCPGGAFSIYFKGKSNYRLAFKRNCLNRLAPICQHCNLIHVKCRETTLSMRIFRPIRKLEIVPAVVSDNCKVIPDIEKCDQIVAWIAEFPRSDAA